MTLPFLFSFTPPGIWVPALSYAMRGAQRGFESDLVPVLQELLCLAGEENTKRRKDSAVWQGRYGRTHGSERAQRRKLLPSWAIQAGVPEEVAVPKKGERGLPAGAAGCAKAGTGRSNRLVQLKQAGWEESGEARKAGAVRAHGLLGQLGEQEPHPSAGSDAWAGNTRLGASHRSRGGSMSLWPGTPPPRAWPGAGKLFCLGSGRKTDGLLLGLGPASASETPGSASGA